MSWGSELCIEDVGVLGVGFWFRNLQFSHLVLQVLTGLEFNATG